MKKYFLNSILILLCNCIHNKASWNEIGGSQDMTGESANNLAGTSVFIAGNNIVVMGEPGWNNSVPTNDGNGRVRVFQLSGNSWIEQGGASDMTGENSNDVAGQSVAASSDGTIVVMGEPGRGNSFPNNKGYGRVRVFQLINNVWTQTGGASGMTGENPSDRAGQSVATSSDGTIVVMGEPGWNNSVPTNSGNGRVRVFQLSGNSWIEQGVASDMAGENPNDRAGQSVATSSQGNVVAIGEPGWSDETGRVRVFWLSSNTWSLTGDSSNMVGEDLGDLAGQSIAINTNGTMIAMSEPGWSGSSGRVRVFQLINNVWTQTGGSLDMIGDDVDNLAGSSVALNQAGDIVAMGETGWSGGYGRVRVFQLQGGTWNVINNPSGITGEGSSDRAGASVGLNSAGNIVAMGEAGWSSESGRVRVFKGQQNQQSNTLVSTYVNINNGINVAPQSPIGVASVGALASIAKLNGATQGQIALIVDNTEASFGELDSLAYSPAQPFEHKINLTED